MNAQTEIQIGNAKATFRQDGYLDAVQGATLPGFSSVRWNLAGSQFGVWNHIYATNGTARTIINRPAEDAMREGFVVTEDRDNLMSQEFDRLSVYPKLTDAIRWARLQGGAALVLLARDGRLLHQKLALESLDEIEEIRVYKMEQISVDDNAYYRNANSTKFGDPIRYRIKPHRGDSFLVHESRLIPIAGEPDPREGFQGRSSSVPWQGASVLTAIMNDLNRYQQSLYWASRLLERKQSPIYSMMGMADQLDEDGGEELVRKRIQMVDSARNLLNTTAIDKEDEYRIENLGVDGVEKIIGEDKIALATSAEMPVTVLFGTSPTGLSATGEGERQNYEGKVSHFQSRSLRIALERLVVTLWAQQEFRSKEPKNWKIVFNPLKVQSTLEKAQADKAEADARKTYIEGLIAACDAGMMVAEQAYRAIRTRYPDYGLEEALPAGAQRAAERDAEQAAKLALPPAPSAPPGAALAR